MRVLVGLVLLCASGLAFANGAPIMNEPLVRPAKNAAFQRAQRTLVRAADLVRSEADGKTVESIGFQQHRFELGALHIRDPQVAYAIGPTGHRIHVGYAMQVKLGEDRQSPWVSVVFGRHGRIGNRLFAGSDSVFASAQPTMPVGVLERVIERDLESKRPLDLVSRWNERRQTRLLDGKPLILSPDKPLTAPLVKRLAEKEATEKKVAE